MNVALTLNEMPLVSVSVLKTKTICSATFSYDAWDLPRQGNNCPIKTIVFPASQLNRLIAELIQRGFRTDNNNDDIISFYICPDFEMRLDASLAAHPFQYSTNGDVK